MLRSERTTVAVLPRPDQVGDTVVLSLLRELARGASFTGDAFVVEAENLPVFLDLLIENGLHFTLADRVDESGTSLSSQAPWIRLVLSEQVRSSRRVVLSVAGIRSAHLATDSAWIRFCEQVNQSPCAALEEFERATQRLDEAWGKRPKWLKVTAVKTGTTRQQDIPRKVGQEVTVRIRGRDYWFPSDPAATNKFVRLGRQNRGKALQWFRQYVRREKHYTGRWPDRGYVLRNRILKPATTRVDLGVVENRDLDTFRDEGSTLTETA